MAVDFFALHPGFHPEFIYSSVNRGAQAIIIRGYHSGTFCTRKGYEGMFDLTPALRHAREKGVLIFLSGVDETNYKRAVEFGGVYPSNRLLRELGIMPLNPRTYKDGGEVIQALEKMITQKISPENIMRRMLEQYGPQ